MDPRARQAREAHRQAGESESEAGQHRALRDDRVWRLRQDDPEKWTHKALAAAVGCSPELIAHILRTHHAARGTVTRTG